MGIKKSAACPHYVYECLNHTDRDSMNSDFIWWPCYGINYGIIRELRGLTVLIILLRFSFNLWFYFKLPFVDVLV